MSLDFQLQEPPCPHCGRYEVLLDRNITHNLGRMAQEAGIYECLWRPNESGYRTASDIVAILETGVAKLRAAPGEFSQFNPPNGWGSYVELVAFASEVLDRCKEHPAALIWTCR